MNALIRITDRIGTWLAWASGAILFATAVLIAIEVVLRKIFSISMGGADEISYYALAISSSWTFGYALLRKAHIRIDVLYSRMSSKVRIALDLLSLTLFGACALVATYFAFFVLQTSIRRGSVANTPLGTPLWIPQSLWFAGLVFLCLVILVLLMGTIYRTIHKDAKGAHELSGASSLLEEIREGTGKQVQALAKGDTP
ncbi:MAG: TRAP transporter small permease [Desulfatitalea sp.]|nr:TRAP transporter small permease [Desulfatitalea sp.]